jgi:nicotinamidase-related amidase
MTKLLGVFTAASTAIAPPALPRFEHAPPLDAMSTRLLDEYVSLLNAADAQAARVHELSAASVGPSDTLVVVDMQHDFLPGGSFGVAEGDATIAPIVKLIHHFAGRGATVIATRDYHPVDHCSFAALGGPFPPHCIQGTRGSFLHEAIADAMQPYLAAAAAPAASGKAATAHVVFKAFSPGIDSFGAFEYEPAVARTRLSSRPDGADQAAPASGDGVAAAAAAASPCSVKWTGGFSLFSSNQRNDANAPPDVLSVLHRRPVSDLLPPPTADSRVFFCGLALDFCVIDSAVNFAAFQRASSGVGGGGASRRALVLVRETRAAHIPGIGKHGSGFLTDASDIAKKLRDGDIALAAIADL